MEERKKLILIIVIGENHIKINYEKNGKVYKEIKVITKKEKESKEEFLKRRLQELKNLNW